MTGGCSAIKEFAHIELRRYLPDASAALAQLRSLAHKTRTFLVSVLLQVLALGRIVLEREKHKVILVFNLSSRIDLPMANTLSKKL